MSSGLRDPCPFTPLLYRPQRARIVLARARIPCSYPFSSEYAILFRVCTCAAVITYAPVDACGRSRDEGIKGSEREKWLHRTTALTSVPARNVAIGGRGERRGDPRGERFGSKGRAPLLARFIFLRFRRDTVFVLSFLPDANRRTKGEMRECASRDP